MKPEHVTLMILIFAAAVGFGVFSKDKTVNKHEEKRNDVVSSQIVEKEPNACTVQDVQTVEVPICMEERQLTCLESDE